MADRFPKDFLWGASSSAFQIEGGWDEGGKGMTVADHNSFKRSHKQADSKVASDFYHHWKEDIALMKELGMKQDRILYSDDTETGCALIMVDENTSQNEIVVILGSCNTISDAEVDSLEDLLDGCEYMLTQLETNVSSVERIVDIACKKGVKVILNTAPVQPISDELLSKVDLITPNEVEAEILTGVKVDSEEAADKAAEWFFGKGVKRVLITLGGRGVYINTGDKKGIIPAYKVNAIDTTGAGDAFNGGLLAALAEDKDIWEAADFANALAALSVQKIGTTPSMPVRSEIDDFLNAHKK